MTANPRKENGTNSNGRSPWFWVPSLYYAEGIPYVIVMTVSVIFYKRMGISNTDIALYTSWLYLPWVIKPLWSPVVDMLRTKRFWIILMQLIIGGAMASVALTIPLPNFFQVTLAILWLMAFSSATHDIAADGFYMIGLDQHKQAWFVGVRSTFYRIAMITGQGLLVIFAGYIESNTGLSPIEISVNASKQILQTEQMTTIQDSLIVPQEGDLRIVTIPSNLSIQIREKSSNEKSTGTVYFYLSKPPETGKKITITFGRESGDKSISLAEGGRYEFTLENWNKPEKAVIELDSKLQHTTSAIFMARAGNIPLSWIMTFSLMAIMFVIFFIYHRFILPLPSEDIARKTKSFFADFINTFALFFKKKNIGISITFLLLYRLAEAQIVKLASPFLLDAQEAGGLALTTGQIGIVYGTVGMIMLLIGGLLGGFIAAKDGLKKWIWLMVIAINLPDAVYIYLAHYQPDSFVIVNLCIGIEQLGYGFGFTAYMLYMIYVSEGEFKTAHFAITTGFMALGMMIPGMFSGYIQEMVGYENFFIWVLICAIPGFIIIKFLPIDPEFGKKKENQT